MHASPSMQSHPASHPAGMQYPVPRVPSTQHAAPITHIGHAHPACMQLPSCSTQHACTTHPACSIRHVTILLITEHAAATRANPRECITQSIQPPSVHTDQACITLITFFFAEYATSTIGLLTMHYRHPLLSRQPPDYGISPRRRYHFQWPGTRHFRRPHIRRASVCTPCIYFHQALQVRAAASTAADDGRACHSRCG
jgi:hypothetical protein